MWKQAKVTVGDETADQAMVDFTGKLPEVLEWPKPLAFNAEVKIGDETFFAGYAQACAGKFHIVLMRISLLPKPTQEVPASLTGKIETQTPAFETSVAKAEAAIPRRKGK